MIINKEILQSLGIILIIVFAGIGVYQTDDWLTYTNEVKFMNSGNETVKVLLNSNDYTRIDIFKFNPKCPGNLSKWVITDDKSKVKCGNRIQYEWQTYVMYEKTYGLDENITNTRKKKSIDINLINSTYNCSTWYLDNKGKNITTYKECQKENHIEVSKYLEHYKGRQSKKADDFEEVYIVTNQNVKLNYHLKSYHTSKNIIKLCFTRFDDSIIKFDGLEEYKIEEENGKKCYYYGYKKGDLFIDPQWIDDIPTDGLQVYFYPNNKSTIVIDNANETSPYNGTANNGVTFFQDGTTMAYMDNEASSSQYVTGTDTVFCNPTASNDCSLSLWFNMESSANQIVAGRLTANQQWFLYYTGGNLAPYYLGTAGTSTAISTGKWYHLVATFDTSKRFQMWINDTLIHNATTAGNFSYAQWCIGCQNVATTPSLFFDGKMANIVSYNEILSDAEVGELYTAGFQYLIDDSALSEINVTDLKPEENENILNTTSSVEISANVSSIYALDWVNATINSPDGTDYVIELSKQGSTDKYNASFSSISYLGRYNITINATDNQSVSNASETTYFNSIALSDIYLMVNGSNQSSNIELGTIVDVNASTMAGFTVCVDVDHPDYGVNYICDTTNADFELNISYFNNNNNNYSETKFNFTYSGLENNTFYIESHQYDEVDNFTLNLTGYESAGSYPSGVKIYVNNSLSNEIGLLFDDPDQTVTIFNDSLSTMYSFISEASTKDVAYIKLPKNANVTGSKFDIFYYSRFIYNITTLSNIEMTEGVTTKNCNSNFKYAPNATDPLEIKIIREGSSTVYNTNNVYSGEYGPNDAIFSGYFNRTTIESVTDLIMYVIPCRILCLGGTYNGQYLVDDSCNEESFLPESDGFDYSIRKDSTIKLPVSITKGVDLQEYTSTGDLIRNTSFVTSYIEVGIIDGDVEATFNSTYNDTETVSDISTAINTYLSQCTADSNDECDVPINIITDFEGNFELTNLEVNYTYNPNPIQIDLDLIEEFLNNSYNETLIPITLESNSGIIQVDDIKFNYLGGNDTIEVIAHDTLYVNNYSIDLFYYYSDWTCNLADNIDYIEFIPNSPTDTDVTPYKQTDSRPIMNITFTNYGGKNANLSLLQNESFSCVNLTISTTNNKSQGTLMPNSTWVDLFTDQAYLNNTGLWMWADYDCSYNTWYLWEPLWSFRSCCIDCVCSEDVS